MASPRLSKGAILALDPSTSKLICSITFQYNPETIVRTLTPNWKDNDPLHIASTPEETINISIELGATDQLEKADPITAESGIYPALSALETLTYPNSRWIFKHYFDDKEILRELADYYNKDYYRFEFKTKGERNNSPKTMEKRSFDVVLVDDNRGYVVKLDKHSKYAPRAKELRSLYRNL